MSIPTRRSFLNTLAFALAPAFAPSLLRAQSAMTLAQAAEGRTGPPASFPTQDPDLVREMVTVAHGNLPEVKRLVERQPSLAKAAWDWGFGDWETALGAASHVGSRPVAEYLLAHGAQPTLFCAAMLGDLAVVTAFIDASPGIERTHGPHGLTLAHHARVGGDRAAAVVEFLRALPGSDESLAPQPLSDSDRAALQGTYVFGAATDERIAIAVVNNQMTFTRVGRIARTLFHRGDLAFSPVGSDAVRVRFTPLATGTTMTIHDPDVVLTARRTTADAIS